MAVLPPGTKFEMLMPLPHATWWLQIVSKARIISMSRKLHGNAAQRRKERRRIWAVERVLLAQGSARGVEL
jgi:hypothetical protein